VQLREPTAVVDVGVVFAAPADFADADAADPTAEKGALLRKLLASWSPWVLLGAADAAPFRAAARDPPASAAAAHSRSAPDLAAFRKRALAVRRCGAAACAWLAPPSTSRSSRSSRARRTSPGDGRGNATRAETPTAPHGVPLFECRWPLEQPARGVGFVRLQLGCKHCTLRVAEVGVQGGGGALIRDFLVCLY
jgi:hypothetical protein